MTKRQYAEYERAVADLFRREGLRHRDLSTEPDSEPHFSWSPCECCGTSKGGDREYVTAVVEATGEVVSLTVCSDCVYYAAYGRLDDTTMLSAESDTTT